MTTQRGISKHYRHKYTYMYLKMFNIAHFSCSIVDLHIDFSSEFLNVALHIYESKCPCLLKLMQVCLQKAQKFQIFSSGLFTAEMHRVLSERNYILHVCILNYRPTFNNVVRLFEWPVGYIGLPWHGKYY